MSYDAIVIGAGPNGLVAAATLGKAGRRVLVLESADAIGGHTRAIEFAPGFRSPLHEDCGWVPTNVMRTLGLGLPVVSTITRRISMSVLQQDGGLLTLPSLPRSAVPVIAGLSQKDAARWTDFVERLRRFATVLGRLYQLPPPDIDTTSLRDVLPLALLGLRMRALGRDDMTEFLRVMPMSVQDLLDDTFESELLKAAVASAAIRDLRQGPRSGGTTFNLLHYMVGAMPGSHRARSWFANGPDAFADAAAATVRKFGGEVRTNARIERITVKDGAVSGVALAGGEEIAAPIVISTADPKRTLLGMVDPVWLDPEIGLAVSNVKLRGCSAFVFYGVDTLNDPDKTFVAPVSLTSTTTALERAADAAKYGEISAEPHIEFFAPTLRWPQLAPDGKHVIAARVQYAPYALKEGAWTQTHAAALEKNVTAAIGRVIPKFAESVKHSLVLAPKDVEDRFGVTEGAITQGELMLDQILFMRPIPGWGRYAMPIRGLYLGGAGAHPGPGILGGAGFLAARAVLRG